MILLTCIQPTDVILFYAQQGNSGTNCLGPAGSACGAGPACAPFPSEAVCFSSSGGFAVGVAMCFNARWANNVMVHKSGPLIVGGYLPRGSTLASQEKRAWLVP